MEQGTLPRTARAHDRDELTLVDPEIDAVQGAHRHAAHRIDLPQVVSLQDRAHFFSAYRRPFQVTPLPEATRHQEPNAMARLRGAPTGRVKVYQRGTSS